MENKQALRLKPSSGWNLGYLSATATGIALEGMRILSKGCKFEDFVVMSMGLIALFIFLERLFAGLLITNEGFSIKSFFRYRKLIHWVDIKEFQADQTIRFPSDWLPKRTWVFYNFVESSELNQIKNFWDIWVRWDSDYDGRLPDTYGMKPQELAELLNKKRKECLSDARVS